MTELNHILAEATPWLHRYGYAAVAVAVMFEGTGIPLPGAILMGGAILLAGSGEMSLKAVVLTAWLAAMAGDNLGYWIGRGGGRRLLLKVGVNRRRLSRFDGFFQRYGIWLVLFGRFFDGTRQLDGLVAGSARMPWPRFLLADITGSALWVTAWVIVLSALDQQGMSLHRLLIHINPWVAGLSLAALAAALYWLLHRGAARAPSITQEGAPTAPPEPDGSHHGRPNP